PVHGVGGMLGTTLTGIFVATQLGGVGYAPGMTLARQVGVQILGVAAAGIWCVIGTYVILKALQATLGLRVTEDQEREGLDLSQHGERAYIE
ncbi:MAG: hypothetical protein ACRES1_05735, partial [Steroidobacteraceae bacterium]